MAGDVIVAQPGTITGSIGVFGGKFSLRGLYDKIGLSKEILTRGRNAALFTEYRPWSDEERLKVRGLMAAFYRDFVHKVAEHRGKSEDEIDAVAQGRVWSGVEALERGLVDKLGGLDVAFDEARQRAKIARGQDLAVIVLPERKSFFEQLMERDDEDARVTRLLPLDVRALLNWASVATEGPLARLPFEVRVR
jgi:protease-4